MANTRDGYVDVLFDGNTYQKTEPLFQYDHGIALRVRGQPSNNQFQIHCSAIGQKHSLSVLGQWEDDVQMAFIPDAVLTQDKDIVCYIYLENNDLGITIYEIDIPVIPRAMPGSGNYTPEQTSNYDVQASNLSSLIEETSTAIQNANTAAASADSALQQAIQDIQAEGQTQTGAVTAEGIRVLGTIPSDYTALAGDVGDLKSAFNFDMLDLNCANILDFITKSNRTSQNVTWSWNGNVLSAVGTASATANYSLFSSQTELPPGISAGKTYRVLHSTDKITTKIYDYTGGFTVELFNSKQPGQFAVPENCVGMIIRFTVGSGVAADESVVPCIVDTKTNKEIVSEINGINENRKMDLMNIGKSFRALPIDKTINLIDNATLATGYILVSNVPTVKANYFYSDYIEIDGLPFCYRDQGASISNLVSCYDASKNFIGAIDYVSHSEYYERITDHAPALNQYYKVIPLPGTVFIRVNGRYTTNIMLCPLFYPSKYVAYGETYYKDALKVAMFGDSITYGTNGDDHSTPAEKNLPYWVEKITGCIVDNHGVGSMGWVSTQYLTEIAYDKISSVDLTGYDVITLCYGVNDTGAVLGEYNSTDETTIMGQINKCVKYIGAQNPKARIIIIAPWNGASSTATFPAWGYGRKVYYSATGDTTRTKTRKDLSNAESELCNVYGCGFIGQNDCPLNGFGLGTAEGVTPGPFIGADLVHPSLDGYKAMGEWLAAKISGIVAFK